MGIDYKRTGDKIGELELLNSNSERIQLQEVVHSDYSIICYLSPFCSGCIESLPYLQALSNYIRDTRCSLLLIWEESIPSSRIKDAHLQNIPSYLVSKLRLERKPSFFIVDSSCQVIFSETTDIANVISRIIPLCDTNKLANNILSALMSETPDNSMVIISSEGCSSCDEIQYALQNGQSQNISIIDATTMQGRMLSTIFGIETIPTGIRITDGKPVVLRSEEDILLEIKASQLLD